MIFITEKVISNYLIGYFFLIREINFENGNLPFFEGFLVIWRNRYEKEKVLPVIFMIFLVIPCPFTGLQMFCADPNFCAQPKNYLPLVMSLKTKYCNPWLLIDFTWTLDTISKKFPDLGKWISKRFHCIAEWFVDTYVAGMS